MERRGAVGRAERETEGGEEQGSIKIREKCSGSSVTEAGSWRGVTALPMPGGRVCVTEYAAATNAPSGGEKEGEQPGGGAARAGLSLFVPPSCFNNPPTGRQRASLDLQPSSTIISIFFFFSSSY